MENMELVAHCGLFCGSCSVYIASQGDDTALDWIAARFNTTREEMRCNGCRSERLSQQCRDCDFRTCVHEKKIENCEDCSSFPCDNLRDFQTKMPHRIELFASARYRKENGLSMWFDKMYEDYSCNACKVVNSPYYIKCKKCGHAPGNNYIERNLEKIKSYFEKHD